MRGPSQACGPYPALADGYAYLDGAAGTQLPEPVIEAIAGAYRAGLGNSGGAFPASARADEIKAELPPGGGRPGRRGRRTGSSSART